MVIRLAVVNMMNRQCAGIVIANTPAYLATSPIPFTNPGLKCFCEFVGINRTGRIGKTVSKSHAVIGAILATLAKPFRYSKKFATLFTDQCNHLLGAGGIIAPLRTKLTFTVCYIASLNRHGLSAMLTKTVNSLALPKTVADTTAKDMLLCLGVVGNATNGLTAPFAWFSPSAISAGVRTKTPLAFLDLVTTDRKRFSACFTSALNAGGSCLSRAFRGTEPTPGSGGSLKGFSALETTINHGTLSVRGAIRKYQAGHTVRRPRLSASDQFAQARIPL